MIATDFAENETDRDPFAVRPPGQDNGDNRTTPMPNSRRMKTRDFVQLSRWFGLDGIEVMSARWGGSKRKETLPRVEPFIAVFRLPRFTPENRL